MSSAVARQAFPPHGSAMGSGSRPYGPNRRAAGTWLGRLLAETDDEISARRRTAMLREQLSEAYKTALKSKDQQTVATVRLINAALKDRDIAAREKGVTDGIEDTEILLMLQQMVKQRRDSISMYEQGGRLDLVEQEQGEISVIERFMPRQLDGAEMDAAVTALIGEIEATSIKDMGRTMAALKDRYAGQMDFAKASGIVKAKLAG